MKKNFKEINPELKKGDVVMLLHMEGESVPVGSRGFVLKKIVQPKYIPTDSGYGYSVNWYDIKNKLISKFPLFPEVDGWVFDKKYYESNPENLKEDIKKACDLCNIKFNADKLPSIHSDCRNKKIHYSKFYNDETKNLVAKMYKEKINKFNYTFESN
jgi:hypothetical protein